MAKQMSQAAKIYLQEVTVLEEARQELFRELDDLWTKIREEAKPQLDELAQAYGRVLGVWENNSEKGMYQVWPEHPADAKKTTKMLIAVRDPRQSETPGNYEIRLRLAQMAQAQIRRELSAAPGKLEELTRQEGLKGPVNWGSGQLWHTEIPITPDDLDTTVSEVTDTVCQLFRVTTEFDKWQEMSRRP